MVFVIAECGVNWRNLSEADQMIKAAAEAGADAAKFQAWQDRFDREDHPRFEELNAIRLDESAIRYLYWRCQQHGIEFMCTPMFPDAVAMLDPYIKRWKIRSADQTNKDIIQRCRDTGKEILISLQEPYEYLSKYCKLLYCIPEYPPAFKPVAPRGFDGYSCHFPNVEFAVYPVKKYNWGYLEVHVRLDKYDPAWDPVDQRVSITMSELRQLCKELGK